MRHVPDSERYPDGMIISGMPVHLQSAGRSTPSLCSAPRIPIDARDHLDDTFHVYDTVRVIDTGKTGKVIDVSAVAGIVLVRVDGRETWVKPREIEHAPDADGTTRYHDDRGHVFAETSPMEPEIQAKLDEILAEANRPIQQTLTWRQWLKSVADSDFTGLAALLSLVMLICMLTLYRMGEIEQRRSQIAELKEIIAAKQSHLEAWAKKYDRLKREAEKMEDQISHWETTGEPK